MPEMVTLEVLLSQRYLALASVHIRMCLVSGSPAQSTNARRRKEMLEISTWISFH
jgi:hypothetical protein